MTRKYLKTFIFTRERPTDMDFIINSWLDSKHEEVGKTIARFEMLYIESAVRGTTVSLFITYTELRL